MDWSAVKSAIGNIAPVLAGTLGTPAAGIAVKAICEALGLNSLQATPDAISAAVASATPEQLKALADADAAHLETVKVLAQIAQVDQADRQDARADSNNEIAKSYAWTAAASALVRPLWGIGCFVLVANAAITGSPIGDPMKDIVSTVLLYFFGSRLAEKLAPTIVGAMKGQGNG